MTASQKPYLINAIHEWCSDYGYTPYLTTHVDENVMVPKEYVKNKQITLDIAFSATKNLVIDKDGISFKATFGGTIHDVVIPIGNVIAIFARENGQGMQFPVTHNHENKSKGGLHLVK